MVETAQPIVHAKVRVQTSYPGAKYFLPADELEKERLNLQHYKLKQVFDNKIVFPLIIFQPEDEILDSATGTGIWLQDFLTTSPRTVSLHGIDIEPLNFPPPSTYSPNIHLHTVSMLSLPTDWTSKFTFVNQRFGFAAAIPVLEIPIALSEHHRVLKPGSWVQILEIGNWFAGSHTEKHKSLILKFTAARGLDFQGYKSLPQKLSEAGFEEVSIMTRTIPNGKWAGEWGEWGRDNMIAAWRAMKDSILDGGGCGIVRSEEEFDMLLDDVEREWDETPGAGADYVVVCGRKPV